METRLHLGTRKVQIQAYVDDDDGATVIRKKYSFEVDELIQIAGQIREDWNDDKIKKMHVNNKKIVQ